MTDYDTWLVTFGLFAGAHVVLLWAIFQHVARIRYLLESKR